jgi:hypothetical protein
MQKFFGFRRFTARVRLELLRRGQGRPGCLVGRPLGRAGADGNNGERRFPGYIEDTDFFQGKLTAERRAQLIAATHDKRPGRPDDVAGLIEFLASPQARHITGQTIHLNGGAYTTR